MTRRVLLTGATGFLGHYLAAELAAQGFEVTTAGRTGCDIRLDLAEPTGFAAALADVPLDLVVNCGAMATMGACQAQPTLALRANGKAPGELAEVAGCRFVQLSTDLVFDGETAPYHSASPTRPLSVYGMSKAAGEAPASADWLVVRLPLLFGRSPDGRRGATDMLRAAVGAKERPVLFSDEFRTPLHAADAARGVVTLAADPAVRGIRHVAGRERVSRWELWQRFAAVAGLAADTCEAGISQDPRRPKDVSLVPDWLPERSLDAALADA